MKIIRNIPMVWKFYLALPSLRQFKKGILQARAEGNLEEERAYILKATDTWGNFVMKVFGTEVRVHGEENIPDRGPVVYVANHQSYADIPLCCKVLNKIQTGFVARDGLQDIPLYGEWILNIRSVIIKRNDPRSSLRTVDEAISLIRQGFSMVIFPEGTRSRGGPMQSFKKGSLRLATKPGVPVVPITIDGTWRIFEEKGYPQRATVDITVHPSIETASLSRQEAADLAETVEAIVRGGLK